MGHISPKKTIIIVLCLAVTSFIVYWQPSDGKAVKKTLSLVRSMEKIKGWQCSDLIRMDDRIINELNLDEYVNLNYTSGEKRVSLYIGYYFKSKKVGAAHSPLVCFPGQGWVLSDFENKSIKIGENKIKLMKIIASIGSRKELLMYWFQAYDKSSPGTFVQKLNTLWSKMRTGREDNAFVRITVPMDGITVDEAFRTGERFIESFYPQFLKYVRDNNS